jgi:type II secretory pathway pseudopilin PulG
LEKGISLIEVILVTVILAITIPTVARVLSSAVVNGAQNDKLTLAAVYAQERLEEIIADAKSPVRGYNWMTPANYPKDVPATGFLRTVTVDTTKRYNGIAYAEVQVTVTASGMSPVRLTTFLTNRN